MLGLSGVVRASENPLKNDCENANTLAHGGVHLVVLAHLQRREISGEGGISECSGPLDGKGPDHDSRVQYLTLAL